MRTEFEIRFIFDTLAPVEREILMRTVQELREARVQRGGNSSVRNLDELTYSISRVPELPASTAPALRRPSGNARSRCGLCQQVGHNKRGCADAHRIAALQSGRSPIPLS
jgi:hypothetical protein